MNRPAFIARAGSSSVTAYRMGEPEPGKAQRYVLNWRRFTGDERQRETVRGESKARERAAAIVEQLAAGRAQVLELTHADREAWLEARRILAPHGVGVLLAVEQWVAAREALGPAGDLLGAVRGFLARSDASCRPAPPTAAIVAEVLARVEDDRRSDKYFNSLKADLERFAAAVPNLAAADEVTVRNYLRGLRSKAGAPLSERRLDNIRDAIVLLSRHARRRGYLPEAKTSAAESIPRRAEGAEIGTYTPAELDAILRNARPFWLPAFALGAFAGMRPSEVYRTSWEQIRWDQRAIAVPGRVAKKIRISRTVPMQEALAAWLSTYAGRKGRIYPQTESQLEGRHEREVQRLHRIAGVVWVKNGLRHSYASYRLAIAKNIEQVALEMGNSPAKIRTNYHDPKTEAEATAYFSLRPEAPSNVIPISL